MPEKKSQSGRLQLLPGTGNGAGKESDDRPNYWTDRELDDIGEAYIKNHHPHLLHAEMRFLVTKKPMNKKGAAVLGQARRATGLVEFYSRATFIVVVSDAAWSKLERKGKEALVDHELCHCIRDTGEDAGDEWALRPHDIEEFTEIIDRHGLWKQDLKDFGAAVARQLELPIEKAKK